MTYLLTSTEVVALAFPDKNFLPAKILNAHLTIAHEGFLRPALGDEFYLHIMTGTRTANDTALINDYLKAPLAMYVRYIILPDVHTHMSNTGIQAIQPAGSVVASDRQAGTLRSQALENAKILMDSAIRYIEQNYTLFPLYDFEETVKSTTKVLGGVIMGGGFKRTTKAPISTVQVPAAGLSDSMVNWIAELRTRTGYAHGALLIVNENNGVYQYDSTSTTPDNEVNIITPGGQTAGRWIMIKEIEMVNL